MGAFNAAFTPEEEETAKELVGFQQGAAETPNDLQETWRKILLEILKTLLKEDDPWQLQVTWKATMNERLEDCNGAGDDRIR